MLKDKWEDKHGSSSKINVASLTSLGSNLQDGQALGDPNLQQLITLLSTKYGPMKTPLQVGTPEYLKLVEILKQRSDNGGTNSSQNVETVSLTGEKSCVGRNDQEKISSSEQLWEGSLQLSSTVTLSAVAFFKSGEKLVGNNWPEFIEVKGKVRLEAFEKYVQDLPRSRNRGLMVTSICWNERSSNIGLNGMKEVSKGYKKSSRVGFAHLLSGTDIYICPRSDPIITILAKYGFFKGMSVLDDKPDSMIGCVVWRKNRPLNPAVNPSDGKSSPSLTQPQDSPPGFSSKQAEKKLSPAKVESSQRDEPLTLPLTVACAEVDHNRSGSSSGAEVDPLVLKKRSFEDDDLPEFDFGVACGKSTLVSKLVTLPKKMDNFPLIQPPSVVNVINDGSLKSSLKKTKLFDDDDMPEWRPPELNNQLPPQVIASNSKNVAVFPPLPLPPPPPPIPPPPRAAPRPPFSHLPIRPPISSQPPVFMRPPPLPLPPPPPPLQPLPPPPRQPPPPLPPRQPLPPPPPRQPLMSSSVRFGSNQVLWHQPPFQSLNGRHPQL